MIRLREGAAVRELSREELRYGIRSGAIPADARIQSTTLFGDDWWRQLGATNVWTQARQDSPYPGQTAPSQDSTSAVVKVEMNKWNYLSMLIIFGFIGFWYQPVWIVCSWLIVLFSVHRMWKALRGTGVEATTPGRAVGLLFLPVFNLVWFFIVHFRFVSGYNRYLEHRGDSADENTPPRLSAAPYVLFCFAAIYNWFYQASAIIGEQAELGGVALLSHLVFLLLQIWVINASADAVSRLAGYRKQLATAALEEVQDQPVPPAEPPSDGKETAARPASAVAAGPRPVNKRTALARAQKKLEQKDYRAALPLLQAALEYEPDNPDAHYGTALAHEALGDRIPALRSFHMYIALTNTWHGRRYAHARQRLATWVSTRPASGRSPGFNALVESYNSALPTTSLEAFMPYGAVSKTVTPVNRENDGLVLEESDVGNLILVISGDECWAVPHPNAHRFAIVDLRQCFRITSRPTSSKNPGFIQELAQPAHCVAEDGCWKLSKPGQVFVAGTATGSASDEHSG